MNHLEILFKCRIWLQRLLNKLTENTDAAGQCNSAGTHLSSKALVLSFGVTGSRKLSVNCFIASSIPTLTILIETVVKRARSISSTHPCLLLPLFDCLILLSHDLTLAFSPSSTPQAKESMRQNQENVLHPFRQTFQCSFKINTC